MSGQEDDERPIPDLPAVQVGYKRPPVEHRFQKGQSGNPRGRPRSTKLTRPEPFDPADQRSSRLILEEAYRPVTIREGHEVFEIPAIQAVMRAMGVAAMKGNRLAQKNLAEIVQRVEAAERAERAEGLEAMMVYKQKWSEHIESCARAGIPDQNPIPHPDDVFLDFRTGKVAIKGPMTAEEKVRWDKQLARRDQAQAEVNNYARKYSNARDTSRRELWRSEWHFEQSVFDLINDSMPERYKAKLENRSYHQDASREGETLTEYLKTAKQIRRKQKKD